MDRRAFLLLTLAGAGSPPTPVNTIAPIGQAMQNAAEVGSGDAKFVAWARDFIERSIKAGWPAEVLVREFTGLAPNPTVLELDSRQPEFSRPVSDYVKGVISDERVAVGRRKRAELAWLPKVEQRFGVPGEILIAIWAMESAFGAVQGDFDAMRSLATLAAAGRRRDWAETQLRALIRIIAEHRATRAQLRGSWAGAMGQTQLGPDSYLTAGVDFDGDDRVDVWKSAPDALASAANLLAIAGWRRGEHWHREVLLPPGFDYGLAEGPKQAPAAWAMLGVRTADGGGWSPADGRAPAVLFLPAGAAGPALLLLPNHFAIRAYNNSSAYALAAGLLADHIGGAPGLVASWPHEDPLSLADRIGAQKALARLGFDPGASDGAIGTNTRAAIRAWQKSRKLPADGYLSLPVVRRLEAEAADPIGAAAAAATS